MTVFMLNMFPLGTVVAVVMLFFSLFRWEKYSTFKLPTELQKS
ncbi:putative membrane protein [Acinetobacter sp. 1000160]|nr:putative membrane protein [Acinetobacter baumannii 146457]EYT22523.1 putative membrane protein [Acinetobacter sp. 1000160]